MNKKLLVNILAVIGFFIVLGVITYDDTMTFTGQFYPFKETLKHMLFGFLFFIPRLVYGKKFS